MNRIRTELKPLHMFLVFLFAGILSLSLTACGGEAKSESSESEQETTQEQPEQKKEEAQKDPLVGTWKISAIESSGIKMDITDELLEAMGEQDMGTMSLEIKEDMSAIFSATDQGTYFERLGTVTRNEDKIIVEFPAIGNAAEGNFELEYSGSGDELVMVMPDIGNMYMKKV
ncbi:MAG: hypothetical protein ACOYD7_05295 [Raoultibacter sp.]|jgi:hypothetical protein